MNLNKINTTINGKIYMGYNKNTKQERFCDYYRCSISESDKLARTQTFLGFPVQVDTPVQYVDEKVYKIEITEGMLEDLINRTNELLEEGEMRSKDPRLMQMYSEYKTMMNLLK